MTRRVDSGGTRIVIISHSAGDLDGAERSLVELVKGVVAHGTYVHVVLPWVGPLETHLRSAGAETSVETRLAWWANGPGSENERSDRLASHLLATDRLIHRISEFRPDVVVTNTLCVPAGALAARALRVPHIWYVREFGDEDHGLRFDFGRERTLRLISWLSERVVVNSRVLAADLASAMEPDKLRVLYGAVEAPPEPSPARTDRALRNLLVLGRKHRGKGQEDAVRAVALLLGSHPEVRLRLVGGEDASYGEHLRALIVEHGIGEQVEFVGATPDVWLHYDWADVVLVCSRNEAFGRVTVEAMKCARPIVGARSAGTAELIRDGLTGLLYEPGDAADLAGKIGLLLKDRSLAGRLASDARGWAVQEINLEKHAEGFLGILGEITSGS
jgi:glycosyltransferase involved in cell wall biosynthesis